MLRLLARRGRAQWPLLAAVLAVVMVGATLLGVCALLLTRTAERAFEVAASRAAPDDVAVTAYTVTVRGRDARSVAGDTRALVTSALAPFAATTAARAASVLRSLPPALAAGTTVPAQTYLSGMDDLPARTVLTAGRWPRASADAAHPAAPLETVVFESTARLLGLSLGSRVGLGRELSDDAVPAVSVTVVGVVRPRSGTGWDRDPLAAAGYAFGHLDGRFGQPVDVYGPFIVDLADLLDSGSTVDRLEIAAHPDLSDPSRRDLDTVAAAVAGADSRLGRTLGDRVQIERVASPLPLTLRAARNQQQVTAAVVLAVAVLGGVLTATALALAGRLTAGVRAGETALLSALGVSPGQLAATATVEATIVGVLAAALAIPASSALHAGLTHLPPLAGAGLAVHPGVTGVQALAVSGGALALAAVLIVFALRPAPKVGDRHDRRELLARSGADLLLVGFAAASWWQLYAQPTTATPRADAVRVLAPALLLTAGAALALRVVLPGLRAADRLARRARGLVLPLAAFDAARRPQAFAAGLLIGLACAASTFGTAFDATWQRSQHDQAELSVGTDLTLALTAPPAAGQGATVSLATEGAVSPAADRGIAVGQWLGSAGEAPQLVAIDTTRAEALLRGRLDGGRSWQRVGAALAPPTRAIGVVVPAGAALTISGTATGATRLAVTPRLVLQDATGLRTPCVGAPVPLDGKEHQLPPCATVDGLKLVAVSLPIAADPTAPGSTGPADTVPAAPSDSGHSRVVVTLTVPPAVASAGPAAGSSWTATSAPPVPGQLLDPAAALTTTAAGTQLRMTTAIQVEGAPDAARNLVATAFPAPGPIPVAVSARFADELGVHRGSELSLTVGTTPVPVRVTDVLPTVPSAPGAAAVLADLDAVSRALLVSGELEFPVDAWWVGRPARADAAERATALRLGTVTTRAAETARLAGGPLRAGLPAMLRLLVPAAALLLLAGVVLHVTCDLQIRAIEVARLRGIGMSRREIRTVLLGQHAAVLLPLIAAGAAVGGLATRMVATLLVRSDTGAAPVPATQAHWPWGAEAVLLAALMAGCTLAVTAVVTIQARLADAAHLRMAS